MEDSSTITLSWTLFFFYSDQDHFCGTYGRNQMAGSTLRFTNLQAVTEWVNNVMGWLTLVYRQHARLAIGVKGNLALYADIRRPQKF